MGGGRRRGEEASAHCLGLVLEKNWPEIEVTVHLFDVFN